VYYKCDRVNVNMTPCTIVCIERIE